jgi:hypothetical protein
MVEAPMSPGGPATGEESGGLPAEDRPRRHPEELRRQGEAIPGAAPRLWLAQTETSPDAPEAVAELGGEPLPLKRGQAALGQVGQPHPKSLVQPNQAAVGGPAHAWRAGNRDRLRGWRPAAGRVTRERRV